jgi:hypothetical protein
MAEDTTRTSNRKLNSGASEYNAISFLVEQAIKGLVNTAIPVRVDSCTKPGVGGSAGYVSATPLVQQRGADGKALDTVSLPQLPYIRLSASTAAVVIDPQPGDVGFAVFAQQDISNLKAGSSDPVQAGSFRTFDMSDGVFIPAILGVAPTTYVHLDPEKGEITLKAPTKITIEAHQIELKGPVKMGGAGSSDTITLDGNVSTNGNITAAGNVNAGHFYGPVN